MNDTSKQVVEKIAEMVQTELLLTESPMTLTQIERTTKAILLELGKQVTQKVTQARASKYPPDEKPCECGHLANYVRRRQVNLHTLFGKITITRAYYLCGECHQGHCPLDQTLGLRPNALSAELARLVAMTGVQIPYEKSSELFYELTSLKISPPCFAKSTNQVGALIIKQEKHLKEQAMDSSFLQQQKRTTRQPIRLYGAIDAVKVHTKADGDYHWRDLKVGAWFEARGEPPASPNKEWAIRAQNIHYYADLSPAHEFRDLVWATGVHHQAHLAKELIILGDGAEWIWNIVSQNFPSAIQILDWFHASEHLTPVAHTSFPTLDAQQEWLTMARQLMWEGHIADLIDACQQLFVLTPHEEIRLAIHYFETHKERMRYAYFRQQGYQIGSGTIESAAKQIGLMRLKVPGATWNEESVPKVAKARASFLSDRWASLPLAL